MCGVKQVAETALSGIDSRGVLFDHPVAVEDGRERLNRAFHHGDTRGSDDLLCKYCFDEANISKARSGFLIRKM
jgi:hypothetical protein